MLHVASDSITRIHRRGIVRRTTPPSFEVVVDRWVHAYKKDSVETLCGRKVKTLHWQQFDSLDFADVNDRLHCTRCATAAAEQSRNS